MLKFTRIAIGAAALSLAAAAIAQKPIIYPAKGQSPEQQNRDEGECYVWARQTTGIDPAALAAAPPPQQQPSGGTVAGTAVKGAVVGTAIGAVAGNAGKGAAIGGITGVVAGRHKAKEQAAAANQQSQAGQQQALNTYYRAQRSCLEGRGYTVN